MIRYDSSYNQEINRVVSNFNRKVRRLEKEERELIPSTVRVSDIKSKFTNRRDLNNYLRELRRFSKRGAEDIVTVKGKPYTRYEIEVYRNRLRREKAALDREIAIESRVKSKYPMQHNIALENLKNRRLTLGKNWQETIGTALENQVANYFKRLEIYDNYFEILFQDAYTMGFPDEKIEYIKEKLLTLSPSQLVKLLENSPEVQFIFDYYHSLTRQNGEFTGATLNKLKTMGVKSKTSEDRAWDAFDSLYKNIDDLVKTYKR